MLMTSPAWAPSAPGPPLPEDTLHLWRIAVVEDPAAEARWRALLSGKELDKLARFRFPADARREAVSRGGVRLLLGAYTGLEPRELAFTAGPKGKPFLAGAGTPALEFNTSHSGDWVLLAFARGRRVGIDVERWRTLEADTLVRDFFHPAERADWLAWPEGRREEGFFHAWTLKEAYLKALGVGLAKPLQSFQIRVAPARIPRWSAARRTLRHRSGGPWRP